MEAKSCKLPVNSCLQRFSKWSISPHQILVDIVTLHPLLEDYSVVVCASRARSAQIQRRVSTKNKPTLCIYERKSCFSILLWYITPLFVKRSINIAISQITCCIRQISHNASFCDRNMHIYLSDALWDFVRLVCCITLVIPHAQRLSLMLSYTNVFSCCFVLPDTWRGFCLLFNFCW